MSLSSHLHTNLSPANVMQRSHFYIIIQNSRFIIVFDPLSVVMTCLHIFSELNRILVGMVIYHKVAGISPEEPLESEFGSSLFFPFI